MNLELILKLVAGITEGAAIIERLRAGDKSAEAAAADWLGVTKRFDDAADRWEAGEKPHG